MERWNSFICASEDHTSSISAGSLGYPSLESADILPCWCQTGNLFLLVISQRHGAPTKPPFCRTDAESCLHSSTCHLLASGASVLGAIQYAPPSDCRVPSWCGLPCRLLPHSTNRTCVARQPCLLHSTPHRFEPHQSAKRVCY